MRIVCLIVATLMLSGCSKIVASRLGQYESVTIAAALQEASINASSRLRYPHYDNHYAVVVPRSEYKEAMRLIIQLNLNELLKED